MTSKYTLIFFTILLATAAISGCTDADAPDTTFNEQAIQKLLDDDTPINDVNDMISAVADSKNYDVDVVKSDSTGKIVSIGVDDGKGNHVRFINDDANPDVDRATLNGKQIYPTTGEATSTQTQLADDVSGDDALYLKIFDREYLENEVLGQPIENYRIPAKLIGEPDHINDRGTKFWENVNEFEKYIESDYDGNIILDCLKIQINDKNRLGLSDKNSDGNIDSIKGLIDDEPIEITE